MNKSLLSLSLLTTLLIGCSKPAPQQYDLSYFRQECERLSGFTGDYQSVPEVRLIFVWRKDGDAVAECTWDIGKNVELVEILH